jgi:type IV pilus assembly protein PilW
MRVVYGIDTNDDDTADRYLEAAGITNNIDDDATPDWEDVVSVRVSLLIESLDDNLTTEPTTYFYAGTTNFQSLDRRIHRAFSTTVGVRNRNP